mgnify:CR=1 FL=1|tara:strand:+ start:757 stop:1245 length:489 start_codon:yes stop_codon:yes gene_type:complete
MSYTKRQLVTAAFEEIGLASFVFDLTDNELLSACKRLDAMMAQWNAKGIRLSYPLPSSPETTSLDAETEVPDAANEAIILNLGIRIAPGYGKTVSPDTKVSAKAAYTTLLGWSMGTPPEKQFPSTLPVGAGNKSWRYMDNPFMEPPVNPLTTGGDGVLDLTS